jgi:hypothetical protein
MSNGFRVGSGSGKVISIFVTHLGLFEEEKVEPSATKYAFPSAPRLPAAQGRTRDFETDSAARKFQSIVNRSTLWRQIDLVELLQE